MSTARALGYAEDAPGLVPGVFRLADPDPAPLPPRTRTALVWDGRFDFEEIDPATGATIARGSVLALVKLTHPDEEELRP